jgi:hypothetical protein
MTQKVPVGYAHAFPVDAFPVDARGENVMMMMSDDDDDDEADANERTYSRWRARISRGKHIAIIGTRSVEPRFTNPCVVRWTRGASNRMESSRETTHTELECAY